MASISLKKASAGCLRAFLEGDDKKVLQLLPSLYQLLTERAAATLEDIGVASELGMEGTHSGLVLEASCVMAARLGSVNILRELVVNYKCDPHCRDVRYGKTPIEHAAGHGHLDVVKYMFLADECKRRGSKVGVKTILSAAEGGQLRVIVYLLEECQVELKDEQWRTAMTVAAANGHLPVLKYLFEKSSVEQRKAVEIRAVWSAAEGGHINILHYLFEECKVKLSEADGAKAVTEAASGGHVDILQYLVEKQQCKPHRSGHSPLHGASAMGHAQIVQYLLSTGRVDPQSKNTKGDTPVMIAVEEKEINVLKVFEEFDELQKAFPVNEFVKGFVLGHQLAGKSTLTKTIQQRASSALPPALSKYRKVTGVKAHTAGIIPIQLHSKELGHMVLYDFAGQHEYYSSHMAVLQNLLQDTPALFLCVVDISGEEETVERDLHYWISFVKNEASKVLARSKVIIVGSHADIAKKEKDKFEKKLKMIGSIGENRLGNNVFTRVVSLDCRKLGGEGLNSLLSILGTSSQLVRQESSCDINYCCHMLLRFLQEKFTGVACTIQQLSASVSFTDYLPRDIEHLSDLLSVLNEKGLVMLLKNSEDLPSSWVIVNKQILLEDVNGTLFAPEYFKQYRNLASNTGLVKMSALKSVFPDHDQDLLIGFLKQMSFCEEIDPSMLALESAVLPEWPLNEDAILFFPALVQAERPNAAIENGFQFGWCLSCCSPHELFSVRYLHVLLLRLAYQHATGAASGFEQRCLIWKHGISWHSPNGVQTLVEVVEGMKAVLLLTKFPPEAELEQCKHRSKLISEILALQKVLCPNLTLEENVIHPTELLNPYPLPPLKQLRLVLMTDVARATVEGWHSVLEKGGQHKSIPLEQLVQFEPYTGIGTTILKELVNNGARSVTPSFCHDLALQLHKNIDPLKHGCHLLSIRPDSLYGRLSDMSSEEKSNPVALCREMLMVWQSCDFNGATFQSLKSNLDNLSLFRGRNLQELLTDC